jgi:transposase
VASQNLQSVLRCHIAVFAAMGDAPAEILYDQMKTTVIGEDAPRVVTFVTPTYRATLSREINRAAAW